MTERQPRGETTEQMRKAPHSAVYLCQTMEQATAFKRTAVELGRADLAIHPVTWLDDQRNYAAKRFSGIVLDHATMLTSKQTYALVQARSKVIKPS